MTHTSDHHHFHPLHRFGYCPVCGSHGFEEHDFKAKRCRECGFTFYHNSAAAVAAFIVDDAGRLLVARRAMEPARGTLDLPGGFVDMHEGMEEACLREIREETGAEAVVESYLFSLPNTYLYSEFEVHTADAFFLCRLAEGALVEAADDVGELLWVSLGEVNPEAFGLQSVRRAVERFLNK